MTDRTLKTLYSLLFKSQDGKPFKPYEYQLRIAKAILSKKHKRVIITATTRAGKTLIMALTTILYALKNSGSKIRIIAPSYKQARILMDYVITHLFDHPVIISQLPFSSLGVERLKKELSKERIVFRNGSEIMILSAHGEGERLWGFGGDLIIVDESAWITDETFKTRIMRMLGDNPESILVEVGNPVKLNHFYEDWHNPNFYKIHINWEECVKEGRLTREFVEEQRKVLTEAEFKMLYEAEFVEELDNVLLKKSWISKAVEKDCLKLEKPWKVLGIDVARSGRDKTVYTIIERDFERVNVKQIISEDLSNVASIVGRVKTLFEKHGFERIIVDDIGVGGGVTDLLKEARLPVHAFNSARKASSQRFANLKAEACWSLRELFEKENIKIPNHSTLISELQKWMIDFDSQGRIKIIDPEDKSPDFADSLMMACYQPREGVMKILTDEENVTGLF